MQVLNASEQQPTKVEFPRSTSVPFTTVAAETRKGSGRYDGPEDPPFSPPPTRGPRELATRALNVLVALIGILATLPIMALAAGLVRASSPGPIIFAQRRVGYCRRRQDRRSGGIVPVDRRSSDRRDENDGGKVFTIYKFRTMTVAEQLKEEWATPEDPRITPIGAFLRKSRIDELPQLFNVLLGDMNIVGPRPEQPGIFAELRDQVNGYAYRQKVRPGITGLAQVSLGYDQTIEDVEKKVEKDLEYIEGRSFWKDLAIMLKTVPVMLFRKGAI